MKLTSSEIRKDSRDIASRSAMKPRARSARGPDTRTVASDAEGTLRRRTVRSTAGRRRVVRRSADAAAATAAIAKERKVADVSAAAAAKVEKAAEATEVARTRKRRGSERSDNGDSDEHVSKKKAPNEDEAVEDDDDGLTPAYPASVAAAAAFSKRRHSPLRKRTVEELKELGLIPTWSTLPDEAPEWLKAAPSLEEEFMPSLVRIGERIGRWNDWDKKLKKREEKRLKKEDKIRERSARRNEHGR